jgi:hypothetical protein
MNKGKSPGVARTRIGRPPEFRDRRFLTVLLEASELEAVHRHAKAVGVSASGFVRGLIQRALALRRRKGT